MFCTRCGDPQSDAAAYCSNCGAPLASHAPPAGQSADPAGKTQVTDTTVRPNVGGPEDRSHTRAEPQAETRPAPQGDPITQVGDISRSQAGAAGLAGAKSPIDFGRLLPGDLLAGTASLLVLISLFFPWYSFAASPARASAQATLAQQQLLLAVCGQQLDICASNVAPKFSVSALGAGAGGWRFLILVVAILVVLYVLSRTLQVVAGAVPSHWQVLIGMTALQGLLVLIAFFANPLGILNPLGSSSWAFGAFLALIAAIAAAVGGVLVMQEDKKQNALRASLPKAAGG
jgi:hypothetical protein